MDMLVNCIVAGVALALMLLNILALGLCQSARDADRQAAEQFESLRRKYNEQVMDDLRKKERKDK